MKVILDATDALRVWNRRGSGDGLGPYLDEMSEAWSDLVDLLTPFTSTEEDVANAYSTGRADAEVEYEEAT